MNKVLLIGRLTKDPELRYTPAGTPVCNASIAVRRPTAKDGETDADFINLVVWGVMGENLAKYMVKGGQIAVEGRIQVSNYQDKDGVKRWKTEVVASSVEFLGNPRQEQASSSPAPMQQPSQQQFGYEVQFNDEDLPF